VRRILNLVSIFVLFIAGFFILSSQGQAANTQPPSGITVSPAFQQVSLPSDESQQPVTFSITNNEPTTKTLNLSTQDFNTLNETGGLLFVGANPTELQKKYGLAKWISLPVKQIAVQPGQTVKINANILNQPDMTPGGHYGALMISTAAPSDSNISIHPVASSLLFITKLGGDIHKLGLADVELSHTLFKFPNNVTLRFHNDGNTHLIPRGRVTITNSKGDVISKGIINDDSGLILPETYRRYYVPLQMVSKTNLPGTYQLHVDFRFDGIEQFRSYQQSFRYLPVVYLLVPVLLIMVALAIIFRYRSHKRKRR
jgi:hypothetical protein